MALYFWDHRVVAELQDAEGWTDERLAVESGTSVSGVRFLRSGLRSNPKAKTISGLCRAFGVEPGVFFSKIETNREAAVAE